jgi:ABC-type transport system involved in multi-copper enzyme maturation permease subunit
MSVLQDAPKQGASLLRYRPWRGEFRGSWYAVWAIARVALGIMFRRKLFWVLYGFSVLIFLFFFFGQYLLFWLETQVTTGAFSGGSLFRNIPTNQVIRFLRQGSQLDGSAQTFGNLIWFEGFIAVIVLALVGSIVVGNDFRFGSLPFYLAKPISRWHYVLGKCLAVAVFVNLMTTLPAVILFVQYGFIDDPVYFVDNFPLLLGVLGYGAVLTVTLSLLLMATATWLRRTVPMVMVWMALFVLFRLLARALVDGMRFDERWRLIDLWNDLYLVGNALMGLPHDEIRPRSQAHPAYWEAAAVVGGVCLLCLTYLHRRIRAVEVVT